MPTQLLTQISKDQKFMEKIVSALFITSDFLRYLLALYAISEIYAIFSAFFAGAILVATGEIGRFVIASYGLPIRIIGLIYLVTHLILLVSLFQLHFRKSAGVITFII